MGRKIKITIVVLMVMMLVTGCLTACGDKTETPSKTAGKTTSDSASAKVDESQAATTGDVQKVSDKAKTTVKKKTDLKKKKAVKKTKAKKETAKKKKTTNSKGTLNTATSKNSNTEGSLKDSSTGKNSSDNNNDKTSATKAKKTNKTQKKKTTVKKTSEKETCTISINCKKLVSQKSKLDKGVAKMVPGSGIIMDKQTVKIKKGDTVLDVTLRIAKEKKIPVAYKGHTSAGTAYIEGIKNIYEFDGGAESGWMFSVNGVYKNVGSSSVKVKAKDKIVWAYTLSLGDDLK